jgi:hypothetical protein
VEELKPFLLFMNNVYKIFLFIPNAVSAANNAYALYNGNTENNPNRAYDNLVLAFAKSLMETI